MDRAEGFTAYVTIGNTDGKLNAIEYQSFLAHVKSTVELFAVSLPGGDWWHTSPTSGRQSAILVANLLNNITTINELRRRLSQLAGRFKQDSIAFVLGTTELIPGLLTSEDALKWPSRELAVVPQRTGA